MHVINMLRSDLLFNQKLYGFCAPEDEEEASEMPIMVDIRKEQAHSLFMNTSHRRGLSF